MSPRPLVKRNPGRPFGISLIEVLVGLLLLSVGLLGVARSQLLSLESSRAALLRSQAATVAAEILDLLRSNPRAALRYVGVYPDDFLPVDGGEAAPCQSVDGCTPLQAAQYDTGRLARYFRIDPGRGGAVEGPRFPGARAEVRATGEPGAFAVRVSWDERRSGGEHRGQPLSAGARVRASVELSAVITP